MTDDTISIRVGQDAYLSYTRQELDESLDRIRKGKDGWTLAHDAVAGCFGGVLLLLIEASGNLNATNKAGRTMLHQAAHWGELDIVDGLLTAGADVDPQDEKNYTPLDLAAWAGHGQVVERLIEAGADFMQEDDNGNTAVHWARGDAEVVLKRHTLKAVAEQHGERASTSIKDL